MIFKESWTQLMLDATYKTSVLLCKQMAASVLTFSVLLSLKCLLWTSSSGSHIESSNTNFDHRRKPSCLITRLDRSFHGGVEISRTKIRLGRNLNSSLIPTPCCTKTSPFLGCCKILTSYITCRR